MKEGGHMPPSFFFASPSLLARHPVQWQLQLWRQRLFRTKIVVYCSVDSFLSSRGKFLHGFDRFMAELDGLEIPCVWLSSKSRVQLDDPRRRAGHTEPFIAEDGCGVYLPEDYFHLKPSCKTVRMARFTCIPIAKPQPASQEALESLAEESGVSIVPLRSLSPRELAQNFALPNREAELVRQRDFDALFFFAGAGEEDITRFKALASQNNYALREQGMLWSLAVGPDTKRCIREVGDLYDRTLRSHAIRFAIAPSAQPSALLSASDRGIRLTASYGDSAAAAEKSSRLTEIAITAPDLWEHALSLLTARS
jgi:predicted mannosyl-3-phosphoglycerate phosphatase (HAD superfamily)